MSESKKSKVLFQSKTSHFIFLIPSGILLSVLFYSIFFEKGKNLPILFLVGLISFIPAFLGYYGKKIVLTSNKVYVYSRNKKFFSWTLVEDFQFVECKNDFLGKLFNYGTLLIVNNKNEYYEYRFLNNPQQTYEHIVMRYEKLMKRLDPAFIPVYKKEDTNQSKPIDSIEDTNENK